MQFSYDYLFWNQTWTTRMSSPVSWESCSRTCLAGLGLVLYANFNVSNCFAVIVVLGLLFGWSPSMLPPSANSAMRRERKKNCFSLFLFFFFWNYNIENSSVTFRLCLLVIGFTNELSILHQIELVPRVQLSRAKGARETSEMIDQLLRPAHDLRRCQSLAAARAFRPETPAIPTTYNIFTLRSCINRDTVAWIELH